MVLKISPFVGKRNLIEFMASKRKMVVNNMVIIVFPVALHVYCWCHSLCVTGCDIFRVMLGFWRCRYGVWKGWVASYLYSGFGVAVFWALLSGMVFLHFAVFNWFFCASWVGNAEKGLIKFSKVFCLFMMLFFDLGFCVFKDWKWIVGLTCVWVY